MSASIHNHIRSNAIAYVALFVALTGGTAYALDGSNTVFTDDIVDGEVRTADLRGNAVTSPKIRNGEVLNADLAPDAVTGGSVADGSLGGADLADRSIGGQKVGLETLSGANVNDSSLFGAEIANETLTASDIGGSAIGASELSVGAFEPSDIARKSAADLRFGIAPNSIQSDEVSDNTLTNADISEPTLDTPEAAHYAVNPSIAVPWTTPYPESPDLRTVAARTVEPGSYVVMAKADVTGDGPSYVACFLLANGSAVDHMYAQLDGDGFAGGSLAMLGVAGSATSNIDLAVRCSRIGADEVRVSQRRLVAVKVNRLIGADAG